MLKACSSAAAPEEGSDRDGIALRRSCVELVRTIHPQAVRSGCELSVFVGTMLVDVHLNVGVC